VRRLNEDPYPAVGAYGGPARWTERQAARDIADALRSTLHERYADASDEAVEDALANVLDSMSPAEAFNFTSALKRIGNSASQMVSDPAFVSITQTALPVLGGAAGTLIGGPVGTALGGKLGSLAASALPTRPGPVPAKAQRAAPVVSTAPSISAAAQPAVGSATSAPSAAVTDAPPQMDSPPAATGGSNAAKKAVVLMNQPEVLKSLVATALGEHGRQAVSGVPVAQILGLLTQVLGKAAADADELMYRCHQPDAAESVFDAEDDSADLLYADLLGADNQELADATGWDWPDR
jgi:hypothetical protein